MRETLTQAPLLTSRRFSQATGPYEGAPQRPHRTSLGQMIPHHQSTLAARVDATTQRIVVLRSRDRDVLREHLFRFVVQFGERSRLTSYTTRNAEEVDSACFLAREGGYYGGAEGDGGDGEGGEEGGRCTARTGNAAACSTSVPSSSAQLAWQKRHLRAVHPDAFDAGGDSCSRRDGRAGAPDSCSDDPTSRWNQRPRCALAEVLRAVVALRLPALELPRYTSLYTVRPSASNTQHPLRIMPSVLVELDPVPPPQTLRGTSATVSRCAFYCLPVDDSTQHVHYAGIDAARTYPTPVDFNTQCTVTLRLPHLPLQNPAVQFEPTYSPDLLRVCSIAYDAAVAAQTLTVTVAEPPVAHPPLGEAWSPGTVVSLRALALLPDVPQTLTTRQRALLTFLCFYAREGMFAVHATDTTDATQMTITLDATMGHTIDATQMPAEPTTVDVDATRSALLNESMQYTMALVADVRTRELRHETRPNTGDSVIPAD